uniref:Small ribosomal subunit protein uS2c n=1 Tax=Phacotus lenticularis TaxID=52965 RepID=A0A0S2LQZ9_9CHLO|nr:ribosomal protein S2 [Phacotus lenticularis]ALO63619.1 ribosomal protein S2 [Phacotus lenticularis]
MVVQNVKKNNSQKKDGGLKRDRVNSGSLRPSNLKRLEGGHGKKLSVGDVCELKITALGPKGIGIDEYSYGYSVLVPNVNLGDQVKAKVLKVAASNSVKKLPKYAIAKVVAVTKLAGNSKTIVNPGEKLNVKISKITSKGGGIAQLTGNYSVVIPNTSSKLGETIEVAVTRAKANYAFAKEVKSLNKKNRENNRVPALLFPSNLGVHFSNAKEITEGSKISCVIPQNAKNYGKYYILKFVKGTVLFIKKGLGAKPGSKVRLSITKATKTYYIANILQLNPLSSFKKHALVRNSLHQMIKNGMHFGEKAVKCNAGMKKYIWLKKQGSTSGVGQPLIKKGRHLINLLKTRRCLNKALTVLGKYALKGRTFLFIGTKKAAAGLIARASLFSQTSFFVNTRWLGGMLTNWKTILKSIKKIRPILKEKQKIIRDILVKRQNIKSRLIKKALLLKKKSKFILVKGQQLISILSNPTSKAQFIENLKKLSLKRTELLKKNLSLLEKRQMLLEKRRELMIQSQVLKEKGQSLSVRYQSLLSQLVAYTQKLRELKYLLMISKQLNSIKTNAASKNMSIYSISYSQLKELNVRSVLPNPPKEILNKIVLTIMAQQQAVGAPNSVPALNNSISLKSTADYPASQNKNVLILSKLLSQFSRFAPYIKSQIKTIQKTLQNLEILCNKSFTQLTQLKATLTNYVQLKQKLVSELQEIKNKLTTERQIIRVVKKKLNYFAAQKRLVKLLPRLKYLPTPQNKIYETVQVLMRKIVDPKLKYPMDQIYDQRLSTTSKKVATARKKNWQRLEKYFGGIANMTKLNKANLLQNVAIIVGQKEEMNAVRECQKLGIKMFNVVDTNCNPTFADHIIPSNDDSRNSIKYILQKFLTRIRLAQKIRRKLIKLQKVSS